MGPLWEKYLVCSVLLLISLPVSVHAMVPVWNVSTTGSYLSDLAISNDGSRLITGSVSGAATVYDQNGTIVWNTLVPGRLHVGIQGNGSTFILASEENRDSNKGVVRAYNAEGSQLWKVNTGCVAVLGMAGNNKRFVVGNVMGDLMVLDDTGQEVARFNDSPKTKSIAVLSVSDKGNAFSYALNELYPQIRYVAIDTKKKRVFRGLFNGTLPGYGGADPINHLVLSSDGNYIVIDSGEGSEDTLSLYTSGGTRLWSKDMAEIRDIAITANGSYAFAGTVKGELLSYTRSGNLSWVYQSGSPVTSLSTSMNNTLAAGNTNGDVYLFDETGKLLWTTRIQETSGSEVSKVRLSRDGSSLVVLVNKKSIDYFGKEPEPVPPTIPLITRPPTPTPTEVTNASVTISPERTVSLTPTPSPESTPPVTTSPVVAVSWLIDQTLATFRNIIESIRNIW